MANVNAVKGMTRASCLPAPLYLLPRPHQREVTYSDSNGLCPTQLIRFYRAAGVHCYDCRRGLLDSGDSRLYLYSWGVVQSSLEPCVTLWRLLCYRYLSGISLRSMMRRTKGKCLFKNVYLCNFEV